MWCGLESRCWSCKRRHWETVCSGALSVLEVLRLSCWRCAWTCWIRHEVQRSGLTQPTKIRQLAKEFVVFLASLRESTFRMHECAMLTAEGEACETKVRVEAGCNASSCAVHFGKTVVAMFLRCKGFCSARTSQPLSSQSARRLRPEPQAITTPCGVCNRAVDPE